MEEKKEEIETYVAVNMGISDVVGQFTFVEANAGPVHPLLSCSWWVGMNIKPKKCEVRSCGQLVTTHRRGSSGSALPATIQHELWYLYRQSSLGRISITIQYLAFGFSPETFVLKPGNIRLKKKRLKIANKVTILAAILAYLGSNEEYWDSSLEW